jgi:hypothetical protein
MLVDCPWQIGHSLSLQAIMSLAQASHTHVGHGNLQLARGLSRLPQPHAAFCVDGWQPAHARGHADRRERERETDLISELKHPRQHSSDAVVCDCEAHVGWVRPTNMQNAHTHPNP